MQEFSLVDVDQPGDCKRALRATASPQTMSSASEPKITPLHPVFVCGSDTVDISDSRNFQKDLT